MGGMAEVWKAKLTGPSGFVRTVVIKRILRHLAEDPTFIEMFMQEARLSARLSHANVVQVFELGEFAGERYLAMEYVRGRNFAATLQRAVSGGTPTLGLATYVVREVCRALAYAYALTDESGTPLRIIHRDVTPSNVMLGLDGAVKLLDFGIAKALSDTQNVTQVGVVKGKRGYLAPELFEGKVADHQSDIFSTGVVLHEALTGRRLFQGTSDVHAISLVREARVEAPSRINAKVPPVLDRVCLTALARDPKARYATAEQMAADLDQVVRSLGWDGARLATTLTTLFPEAAAESSGAFALVSPDAATVSGAQPPAATVAPAAERPTTPSAQHRKRLAPWIGAALGGVMVVGVATGWMLSRPGPAPPAPGVAAPSAPPPPAPSPAPPPLPRAPTQVVIGLDSNPSGAQVFVDGERESRGVTPFNWSLAESERPLKVILRRSGYRPASLEITPTANQRLQVPLAALGPTPASTQKKPTNRRPANLENGDVVDPFR